MTEISNPQVTDQVVHLATLAADEVAIYGRYDTPAEKTEAIVRRALEALEANGVIYIVPDENHPFFYKPFPPFGEAGETDTGIAVSKTITAWKGEV